MSTYKKDLASGGLVLQTSSAPPDPTGGRTFSPSVVQIENVPLFIMVTLLQTCNTAECVKQIKKAYRTT